MLLHVIFHYTESEQAFKIW